MCTPRYCARGIWGVLRGILADGDAPRTSEQVSYAGSFLSWDLIWLSVLGHFREPVCLSDVRNSFIYENVIIFSGWIVDGGSEGGGVRTTLARKVEFMYPARSLLKKIISFSRKGLLLARLLPQNPLQLHASPSPEQIVRT